MIIAILISLLFWLFAKKKDVNPIRWAVIAGLSYFVAQFIVGFIIGFTDAFMYLNYTTYFMVRIGAGLCGVLIVWFVMNKGASNKDEFDSEDFSSELGSDEFLEKL